MIGRLLCRLDRHRWQPATFIAWRDPATGARHSKGVERCARGCTARRAFDR